MLSSFAGAPYWRRAVGLRKANAANSDITTRLRYDSAAHSSNIAIFVVYGCIFRTVRCYYGNVVGAMLARATRICVGEKVLVKRLLV